MKMEAMCKEGGEHTGGMHKVGACKVGRERPSPRFEAAIPNL
jgi:hypothetical protein